MDLPSIHRISGWQAGKTTVGARELPDIVNPQSDSPLFSLQSKEKQWWVLTSDVCDAHEQHLESGQLRVLSPGVFQAFGRHRIFSGKVVTVKVFEDNVLVRRALEEPGAGKILVVDGGGSLRTALVGGNVAKLGETQGWAGIIINGCVRDVDEINECNLGVRALAPCPVKSKKKGQGEMNVAVVVAGVRINPGDSCYVDNDGILVSSVVLEV